MQKLVIEGGVPLEGEITLHGAKNSALPILAGALLCDGRTVLENSPRLTDVFAACRILTHLGCRCRMCCGKPSGSKCRICGQIPFRKR